MAQRNRTCRGLSLSPLALGRWWLFGSAIVFSCYILSHSCQMSRQGAGKPFDFWVYRCTKYVLAWVYPSRSCSKGCDSSSRVMSDSVFPVVHLSNAFYAQGAGCSPPPAARITPHCPSTSRTGSSPSEWRPPPLPGGIYTVSTGVLPSFASRPGPLPSSASQWCGFCAEPR